MSSTYEQIIPPLNGYWWIDAIRYQPVVLTLSQLGGALPSPLISQHPRDQHPRPASPVRGSFPLKFGQVPARIGQTS